MIFFYLTVIRSNCVESDSVVFKIKRSMHCIRLDETTIYFTQYPTQNDTIKEICFRCAQWKWGSIRIIWAQYVKKKNAICKQQQAISWMVPFKGPSFTCIEKLNKTRTIFKRYASIKFHKFAFLFYASLNQHEWMLQVHSHICEWAVRKPNRIKNEKEKKNDV